MILTGTMHRVGKYWAIECPAIDAATQGTSKKNALDMMVDWVRSMLDDPEYPIEIMAEGDATFAMRFVDPRGVVGLLVAHARAASGLTLDQLAEKTGKQSRSAVRHYETGKNATSLQKMTEILNAVGYDVEVKVRPVAEFSRKRR